MNKRFIASALTKLKKEYNDLMNAIENVALVLNKIIYLNNALRILIYNKKINISIEDFKNKMELLEKMQSSLDNFMEQIEEHYIELIDEEIADFDVFVGENDKIVFLFKEDIDI